MTKLNKIERQMNFFLPNNYKQFYISEKFDDFKNININTNNCETFLMVKFMKADEIISTYDENYNFWSYNFLPIAYMEYGDFMCLDFRNNNYNPQIVYWSYELAIENLDDSTIFLFDDFENLYNFLADYKSLKS